MATWLLPRFRCCVTGTVSVPSISAKLSNVNQSTHLIEIQQLLGLIFIARCDWIFTNGLIHLVQALLDLVQKLSVFTPQCQSTVNVRPLLCGGLYNVIPMGLQ